LPVAEALLPTGIAQWKLELDPIYGKRIPIDEVGVLDQLIKMWPGTPKNDVIITPSEAVGVLTHSGL
jgi:hypothetical protein